MISSLSEDHLEDQVWLRHLRLWTAMLMILRLQMGCDQENGVR